MSLALALLLGCPADPGEPPSRSPDPETTTGGLTVDTDPTEVGSTGDTGTVPVVDTAWDAFVEQRDDVLVDLGVPILDCPLRNDTSHPAFHGCIDWHSAVHGTWALLALYRLTGDLQYLDVAEQVLRPGPLDAELSNLLDGELAAEVP